MRSRLEEAEAAGSAEDEPVEVFAVAQWFERGLDGAERERQWTRKGQRERENKRISYVCGARKQGRRLLTEN